MAESDQIEAGMLPAYLFSCSRTTGCEALPSPAVSKLEMMERETLLGALARNDWVQQKAAREIGLTLRQMGYRVKKYEFDKVIRKNKRQNLQLKKLSN